MAAIRATNRTQRLVLGFFVLAWIGFVAILLAAAQIYETTLKVGPGAHRLVDLAFLISISAFIAVLAIGVVRRWRWTFWLIVVAFLFGIVRMLTSALQLISVLPAQGPAWYAAFQGVVGVVQFLIALAMIAGYRNAGVWGAY